MNVALFSKMFGDRTPPPIGRLDETLDHPKTRVVQNHARKKEWRAVRDVLAAEPDPILRRRYMGVAVVADGSDEWIDGWLAAEPESADAWLVKGDRSIARAWEIRGSAKADETAEDRWDPFHEMLDNATEELFKAAELNREDPLPWARLLNAAMALGAPIEDRLMLFENGSRRAPAFHGTHISAVGALAEKWGGSHDLMFSFARDVAANAPARSAVATALAYAHVERWLYIGQWENDEKGAETYFARPSVRDEIRACHARCQEAPESAQNYVANLFAFCFYLGRDRKAAKEEFRKAKGVFSGLPWIYLGEDHYKEAIAECW